MEANSAVAHGLMDVEEVAKYLGVCERSVWERTSPRGPLVSVKLGRRVLYTHEDVQEYVRSLRVQPRG